jgi:pyruvate dehydrogenase E1 component alpha subunit
MLDSPSILYDQLFYRSLLIRKFEEKIIELYPSDKIQSPVHLSIGQEAVAVGVCSNLTKNDLLFGTYRSHAYYIAKGGKLTEMMAELYGKVTGSSKGKAGSMHLADPHVGMMGSSAVVASTIPHAIGAALAARNLKKDQIIVSVFGDGATDEGVYHESINFAAVMNLPVLFICENNNLAVHSFQKDRQSFKINEHANSYGIASEKISEGYDFLKIHERVKENINLLIKEGKPRLLEIETSRYCEHVGPGEDFDAGYRSSNDYENWKSKDPLISDKESIKKFLPGIEEEIQNAVNFAEDSPWPDAEELLTDIT